MRFIVTGGQVGDVTQAEGLIADVPGEQLIADTAYDADRFRARLDDVGMTAVIPSNPSRAQAIPYDAELYKERHLVECFINKIKHFRRIATRYIMSSMKLGRRTNTPRTRFDNSSLK